MEPLSLIFSAIVAGATAALKPTAEQAVKDAYAGLKALIKRKWNRVEMESLERDPADQVRQQLVKSDLQKADDLADGEVLEQAKQVLAAVKKHDPAAAASAGITIEDLDAGASVNIENLVAEGVLAMRRIKAGQDINIKGARSGNPSKR
jgi:Na+-transporting NADH:ubiquinone oxidoreductase subunit NqrC